MQAWNRAAWQNFFNTFNNTEAGANAPHVKAMYELDAYLHAAATDKDLANKAANVVIGALVQLKDVQEKNGPLSSPFGKSNVMGFSNMNDMAKELNKMMSGGGLGMQGNTTSIKLDMIEYKKLGLSVGDKVFLDLTKAESSGV